MTTRLVYFSEKIVENGWLIAILATPLFINIYGIRIFEEDKINLLRTVATILLPFLILLLVNRRHAFSLKTPLVIPSLLTLLVLILTTLFSILPANSFFGEYFRRQGCYTQLSYLIFFFSILYLLRTKNQIKRIVDVMIITTIPICLYGMVQYFGWDPFKWEWDVHKRIISTAGNAIFIAAYLAMILPLTLMHLLQGKKQLKFKIFYSLLLVMQGSTIIASNSRGPLLALIIGLMVLSICYGLYMRQRKIIYGSIMLFLCIVSVIIALNSSWQLVQPLRSLPALNRLSHLSDIRQRSQGVRFQIWHGISDMIKANPQKMILGFGPETMQSTFVPYYPVDLGKLSAFQLTADRAHNDTFDLLVTQGFIGVMIRYLLLGCFCFYILNWLGLIRSGHDRTRFVIILLLLSAAGALLPVLLYGNFTFSGIGLPAGFILGIIIYFSVINFTITKKPRKEHPYALLLMVLFTMVIIHFLEIQVGIAIAATQLYFWICLALAVAAGTPLCDLSSEQREKKTSTDQYRFYGLLFIIMLFNFYTPAGWQQWTFPVLFVVAFMLLAIHARLEYAIAYKYLLLIMAPVLIYALLHRLFLITFPGVIILPNSMLKVAFYDRSLLIFYVVIFAYLLLAPWRRSVKAGFPLYKTSYLLPLLLFFGIVFRYNIYSSIGDMNAKQALQLEKGGHWDGALIFYRRALEYYPHQQKYQLDLSRNCILMAQYLQLHGKPPDQYLQVAELYLYNAYQSNPYSIDIYRNLAYLHRNWAALTGTREERRTHLSRADLHFKQAIVLGTKNVRLWNEWAMVAADLENYPEAINRLKQSLAIDADFSETYNYLGMVYLRLNEYRDAISCFRHSLKLDGTQITICHRIAAAYIHLGQPQQAIQALLEAYLIDPNHYNTLKGLLYLYITTKEHEKALIYAQKCLQIVPASERELILNISNRLQPVSKK